MKSKRKFLVSASLSIGAIVLICAIAFLIFPDPFVNVLFKGKISEAFQKAQPEYSIRIGSVHYSVWENRIGFDSVALTRNDSTLTCTIAECSVEGVNWWDVLHARTLVPNGLHGATLDAHGFEVSFPQEQYTLHCGRLHLSVPDSQIVVEALTLHPVGDDEHFFGASKFRKTRFQLDVPYARVMGLACLELFQGKIYSARSADVRDGSIDVLINKDKPAARDTSSPPMPNEIAALIGETIKIDSLTIGNAGLTYGETYVAGAKPAVITLDNMQVSVRGMDIHDGASDTVVMRARGEFMKSAEMNLLMSIPISSPEFSLQYSGSLRRMNLEALNPFLEIAEGKRFKSGIVDTATFDVRVVAGRASGSVRAVYSNLIIAAINKRTGSEKGIFDRAASFVANNITLRTTNTPGKEGAMKIGNVKYTRQRDDPFLRFVWFALRSGVGDVVGF